MEKVYEVNEFRCYTAGLSNLNPQQGHKIRNTRPRATLLYVRVYVCICVCVCVCVYIDTHTHKHTRHRQNPTG